MNAPVVRGMDMQTSVDDGPSVAERVAKAKASLLPHLFLDTQRREGRSRSLKRRSDTSESSLSRKAARLESPSLAIRRSGHRDDYFTELQSQRAFHATDCVPRLSKELGVRQETDAFGGTLIRGLWIDGRQTEHVWKCMKGALDISWSEVALREGVALAKSGKYTEAIESYEQALKLNPNSCDVYVARGAAYANQGFYDAALKDFDRALDLNSTDRNAMEYKTRIERRKMEREARIKPFATQHQPHLQYRQGIDPIHHHVSSNVPSFCIRSLWTRITAGI